MRFLIRDLTPDTLYAVEMRYKSIDAVSEWSRVFNLQTMTDERIPNTPTGVSWISRGSGFHAEWNHVTNNTNGTGARIIRYEVEITTPGGTRKVKGVTPQDDEKPHYDLNRDANEALFGSVQETLTFRVRAVNMAENKSAWSAAITTSFPVPNAPTNVTWVKSEGSFFGDWKEVTQNTNGTNATIIRYEVELTAAGQRHVRGITKQTDSDPSVDKTSFTLSREANKAMFGSYQKTVGFRVRAVNKAEQKSAWTGIVTKDLGTPKTPTNVTWVTQEDGWHGEWDKVAQDTDNTASSVDRYEVELTGGGIVRTEIVMEQSNARQVYDLTAAKNASTFGSFKSPVAFRVRAWSKADVASAWSTSISVSGGVPDAPTNLVLTPGPYTINVAWSAPTNTANVARYRVYASSTSGQLGSRVYEGTSLTYTHNTINTNTVYFTVKSVSALGVESTGLTGSAAADPLVDIVPPPGASIDTTNSNITSNSDGIGAIAYLAWTLGGTAPADLMGFEIRARKVGETTWEAQQSFDKDARSGVIPLQKAYTNYEFQIRSLDNLGNTTGWSATTSITAGANKTPAAPTGLSVTPSGTSFVVTWNAVTTNTDSSAANDISHYEVGVNYSGGTESVIRVDGRRFDLTQEINRGLFGSPKASVIVRVRAVDTGGLGTWSGTTTATNSAPAAPTALTSTLGANSISIGWTAPADTDIKHYNVYQGTSANPTTLAGKTTSPSWVSIVNNTTPQYFSVKAVDVFDQEGPALSGGPFTATNPFIVDTTAPAVPSGLASTITNNDNGVGARAAVTWTANGESDLAGYVLAYKRNSDTVWTEVTYSKDQTSATIDLPYAFTAYDFRIRAVDNSANYSAFSSTLAKAAVANTAPNPPGAMTATAAKDSIQFSWGASSSTDVSNYEVQVSTSSTFASGNLTFFAGNALSLNVGGLSTGTTYYARIRAIDTGGLTSSWVNLTGTSVTTGTFPNPQPSDGVVPAVPGTPTVSGGLSNLYVTWAPVTTNASGGSQPDVVTYEVHLSATSGFTPAAGTKVTEIAGTSAVIENLPGTSTPLSYDTNYYVKLVAKDRDGTQSTASPQSAAAQISRVVSGDVTSIGANLIVPGTGIINALVIGSGGSVQSGNYSPGASGWKISQNGAEFLDSGSTVSAAAIKAGTLGGPSGSGVINVAAGTSLIFNGGYMKSNTNSGTTMATAETSGTGFYLGNDGLFIGGGTNGGRIKANALISDTLTSTVIQLGTEGIIQTINYNGTSGFKLDSTGLSIPDGSLQASKLLVSAAGGNNLWTNSSFEKDTNGSGSGYFDGWSVYSNDAVSTSSRVAGRTGGYAARVSWSVATAQPQGLFRAIPGGFKTGVPYTLSWWARGSGSPVGKTFNIHNNAPAPTGVIWRSNPVLSSTAWQRYIVTFYRTDTNDPIFFGISNTTEGTNYIDFDDIQIEESELPSGYSPFTSEILQGVTTIDGGMIKTGSIISTATTTVNGSTVPRWSIPVNGSATFAAMSVLGDTVIGNSTTDSTSMLRSTNWSGTSSTTGWGILGNGQAYFQNATIKGYVEATSGSFSGTITATGGSITGSMTVSSYLVIGTTTTGTTIGAYPSYSGIRVVNGGVQKYYLNSTTGDVTMSGSSTINGTLSVSGQTYLYSNLSMQSGASITGTNYTIDASGMNINSATIGTSTNKITIGNGTIYSPNSTTTGWKLNSDGTAYFGGNVTVKGTIEGATILGTTTVASSGKLSIGSTSSSLIEIENSSSSGQIKFSPSSSATPGYIKASTGTDFSGGARSRLDIRSPISGTAIGTEILLFDSYIHAGRATTGAVNDFKFSVSGNFYSSGISVSTTNDLSLDPAAGEIMAETLMTTSPPSAASTDGYAVRMGTGGRINRVTSSIRYKTDIVPLVFDTDNALDLEPKAFTRIETGRREIGFIAEDASALGLNEWVIYNSAGQIDSFQYDGWVIALHAIARKQRDDIAYLRGEVERLRNLVESTP